MKTSIKTVILLSILWPGVALSQDFEVTPSGNTSDLTINIEYLYAKLQIIGHNDKKVKIEASNYQGYPAKAKGLTPLSATGPENTGIGLSVSNEGNIVKISGTHRKAHEARYKIYVPQKARIYVNYNSFQNADGILFKDLEGEIEVTSKIGDLVFEDVTGPIVASTLSSNIDVIVTNLDQNSPTSLTSTSGDIDLSLPSSTKGDFEFRTVSGEIYTDLNFEFPNANNMKRVGGGGSADAILNGGGVKVSVRCVSGDIYVRKQ